MSKTPDAAYELLEEMAVNNYQWPTECQNPRKAMGVQEVDAISALTSKVQALSQQLRASQLTLQPIQKAMMCEFCTGPHLSHECQQGNPFMQSMVEQTNYVGQYTKQYDPHSNTYNPAWRQHLNFSYANQNVANPTQVGPSSNHQTQGRNAILE